MKYYTFYDSPIGRLTLASDGEYLSGLWIENQKYYGRGMNSNASYSPDLQIFIQAARWLDEYFTGRAPTATPPKIMPHGTDFQRAIWYQLQNIPYAKTTTYREIAAKLGTSPRAVGGAVGRNPISIIVPCHRVVGINGDLTGYAGGVDAKTKLLRMEGIIL